MLVDPVVGVAVVRGVVPRDVAATMEDRVWSHLERRGIRGETASSSKIRKRLAARHPWFRALFRADGSDRVQQFMADGDEVDGVQVRVAELTGEAGDVAVMLPWTMHTISMHSGTAPRIVANHTTYRAGTTIFSKSA